MAFDKAGASGHEHAVRILKRQHFKVLYSRNPEDIEKNLDSVSAIYEATCGKFGEDNVRYDKYTQKGSAPGFPVLKQDNRVVSSTGRITNADELAYCCYRICFH